MLVILVGPSTSGKSTILQEFSLKPVVSVTTRPPRPGEVEGLDYYFVSNEEYDRMDAAGELPEKTTYAGVRYGVSKFVLDKIKEGTDDYGTVMDTVGVEFMRNYLGEENVKAIYVGIRPETMEMRFRERGSSEDEISRRIEQAKAKELAPEYRAVCDTEIWNDNGTSFEETVEHVRQQLLAWGFFEGSLQKAI